MLVFAQHGLPLEQLCDQQGKDCKKTPTKSTSTIKSGNLYFH